MKQVFYGSCELEKCFDITALYTAFTKTFQKGEGSSGEFHNFWELVVVIDGTLTVATGKGIFSIKKNSMILHPPMAFHRHLNEEDVPLTFLVLTFDAKQMPIEKDSVYVLDAEEVKECRDILNLIYEKYFIERQLIVTRPKVPGDFSGQEVKSRLELFFVNVCSGKMVSRKNVNFEYQQIVRFIKENLTRNLTLADMASALCMSTSKLKKVFSGYSGMGVITYYNRCRMKLAYQLLEQGHFVREVAELLEYSSQSAFCTAFKNTLGFPPSKVRKDSVD